jgi:aminoglycoside 6'-N-acetyltransferase
MTECPRSVHEVRLEPFVEERDAELVKKWLREPHVAKWWGDPAKHEEFYLERPEAGGDAMIVADGVQVGFVTWREPTRSELEEAGLGHIPPGTMDIDIAIGLEEYIGLGIGSRALRVLIDRLQQDESVPLIMLATSVDNHRAIKAYESAGFERQLKFDDGDWGIMWLLTVLPQR